jgi:hypothetical protein
MIGPLTNGAGGNDHLDLVQPRAAHALGESGRLPERLDTDRPAGLDHVAARRKFELDGREINGQQM